MNWQTACGNNIGGREEQQDRVAIFHQNDWHLLVVADGMGGHKGGALASQAVIDAAATLFQQYLQHPLPPEEFLRNFCLEAHHGVNAVGVTHGLTPRSTVAALLLHENHAYWVHVGDCRLYHFRQGALLSRTHDHSMVQILVDMGEVSEEEMATHPNQNRLLASIGGEVPPKVDFNTVESAPGDSFVLCSDGCWETIKTDEMAALAVAGELEPRLAALLDTASQRGGKEGDNISVAVAMASAPPRSFPWLSVVLACLAGMLVGWWLVQ